MPPNATLLEICLKTDAPRPEFQGKQKNGPPDRANRFLEGLCRFELPKVRRKRPTFVCRIGSVTSAREADGSNGKRCEKPVHPDGTNRLLELLGRFELPTSSLPMTRSLFWLAAACCSLSRKVAAPQGKRDFACRFLLLLAVTCNMPFFGVGMGFVWFFPKTIQRDLIPYLRPF